MSGRGKRRRVAGCGVCGREVHQQRHRLRQQFRREIDHPSDVVRNGYGDPQHGSFTGVAAAMGGFLYGNQVMLTGGILVGSAGTLLTVVMCRFIDM